MSEEWDRLMRFIEAKHHEARNKLELTFKDDFEQAANLFQAIEKRDIALDRMLNTLPSEAIPLHEQIDEMTEQMPRVAQHRNGMN